jgi:hypothetical protein
MEDIVQRLRGWSHWLTYDPAAGLMHEAATEIERLRTFAEQATPSEGSVQGEGTEPVAWAISHEPSANVVSPQETPPPVIFQNRRKNDTLR